MKRLGPITAVAALMFVFVGCENQQIKALEGRNRDLMSQLAEKEGEVAQLESDLDACNSQLSALQAQLQGTQAKLDAANRKIQDLLDQPTGFTLDPVARAKLRDIANRYSDQLEYDEDENVVRVKEAINFSAGKSNITEKAREAIGAVANVLDDIGGVAFRVSGHTDSDPIQKSRLINKDNMDLSLKRAHAVWEVLMGAGLEKEKMFCAGFGPTKPLVPNNSDANKRKNRRVEILVMPED